MGLTSNCPKFWSHSSKVMNISTICLCTVCIYAGAHWFLHPLFNLRLSNMYNICVDPNDHYDNDLFFEMSLIGLPLIAVTSATPVIDAVTYRFVSAWSSKRKFCTGLALLNGTE